MDLLDKIKEELEITFKNDQKRLNHIYGVEKLAVFLGNKLGYDSYKCSLAALLHDIHKNLSYEEQLAYLNKEQIDKLEDKVEAHAVSASIYAKKMYNILEKDVIIAIKSHVYGNMNMSLLDKIILVSDFAEETRTYPYCIQVRNVLEEKGFDEALKLTLNLTIKSLEERGITPTKTQYEINRKYGV